ncbi:hypothetical protein ACP4OV_013502 [Aristida adscensionis]
MDSDEHNSSNRQAPSRCSWPRRTTFDMVTDLATDAVVWWGATGNTPLSSFTQPPSLASSSPPTSRTELCQVPGKQTDGSSLTSLSCAAADADHGKEEEARMQPFREWAGSGSRCGHHATIQAVQRLPVDQCGMDREFQAMDSCLRTAKSRPRHARR